MKEAQTSYYVVLAHTYEGKFEMTNLPVIEAESAHAALALHREAFGDNYGNVLIVAMPDVIAGMGGVG